MIRIAPPFDDYLSALAKNKHFDQIVVGHAMIEGMMTEALMYAGMDTEETNAISYDEKIVFCVEQGIYSQERSYIFEKLNRLRNQILNMNRELDKDLIMDLYEELKEVGFDSMFLDRTDVAKEDLDGIIEQDIISGVLGYCFYELSTAILWMDGPCYV